jgi:hypothetical protein
VWSSPKPTYLNLSEPHTHTHTHAYHRARHGPRGDFVGVLLDADALVIQELALVDVDFPFFAVIARWIFADRWLCVLELLFAHILLRPADFARKVSED